MNNDTYILEILKSSALFKQLPERMLTPLLPHMALKTIPQNTVLFDDGSKEVDGMYIIAKGFVKIYKSIPGEGEARQQAVAVLPAGSYFGEMALLEEEARSAGAVTMYESELLFLSKESFHQVISQNLEVAHEILTRIAKTMSKRLRDTNNLFREVVSWGYKARKEVRDLKSNFLSTISHELRTPIHSIQGFSTLMKESGEVDEETKQRFVDVILHESKRLADLINDLIALAEIEYGSIVIERKPGSLSELIQKAYETYRDSAAEKKLDYRMNVDETIPLVVVDGPRLVQALEHLIENAIKFTAHNGQVTIGATRTDAALEIAVRDTGKGIPSKYLERIFDKFYQVDQSTTRVAEGAGIGLSLARHIVDLHGGHIQASSEEGRGTTITILLPNDRVFYNEPA